MYHYFYEYDDNGNMIKESAYNILDNLQYIYEYSYDEKGRLTRKKVYDGNKSYFGYINYEYNKNGKPITESSYSSDGEIIEVEYYTEDKEFLGADSYQNGKLFTYTEVDTKTGNITFIEYYGDGKQKSSTLYDKNWKQIEKKEYDPDVKIEKKQKQKPHTTAMAHTR